MNLQACGHALGTGETALQLGEDASYTLTVKTVDGTDYGSQTLNRLELGKNSQVILGAKTELTLNLNSSYLSDSTNTETEIGEGQLKGSGSLVLSSGTVTFSEVFGTLVQSDAQEGVEIFSGKLTVNDNGIMIFDSESSSPTSSFNLNLSGKGTAQLKVDTVLEDMSGFTGTVMLVGGGDNGRILTVNDSTRFGESTVNVFNSGETQGTVKFVDVSPTDDVALDAALNFVSKAEDGSTFSIKNFEFVGSDGIFKYEENVSLVLEDSSITRQKDTFDQAEICSTSTLTYKLGNGADGGAVNVNLSSIISEGALVVEFESKAEISISNLEKSFTGTFHFANGTLEIGSKHDSDTDNNNALAGNNALYVGSGSTLVMNGSQTLGKDLTLGGGSALDFTLNSDSYVTGGVSVNALDMGGKNISFGGDGTNIGVSVIVDPTFNIEEADTSGTLMQAVREQAENSLSLVLIDNIGTETDASALVSHMQLENASQNRVESAKVTYFSGGKQIADITTDVGLVASAKQIGLSSKVTLVEIYDGYDS